MKGKSFLILIIFALIIGFIIFYLSEPVKKPQVSLTAAVPRETAVAQLEAQVQQLKDVIQAFVQMDASLQKEFGQEREKLQKLEEVFKEAISQNEILGRELTKAKAGLELTHPIRERLKEINNSLTNLGAGSLEGKELSQRLRSIAKELDAIDRSIPNLLRENKSYKAQAQSSSLLLDRKKQELASLGQMALDLKNTIDSLRRSNYSLNTELRKLESALKDAQRKETQLIQERQEALMKNQELMKQATGQKEQSLLLSQKNLEMGKELHSLRLELKQGNLERQLIIKEVENATMAIEDAQGLKQELIQLQSQIEQLSKDYAGLKSEHGRSQEMLKDKEIELGKRADRILNLQAKLSEVEANLSEVQLKYKGEEKGSAILREQYVAIQLERESLKNELDEAKVKLTNLRSQLQQMAGIFNMPLEQPQAAPAPKLEEEISEPQAKKVDVKLLPQTEPEIKNEERPE